MCIRDRIITGESNVGCCGKKIKRIFLDPEKVVSTPEVTKACLLYTSDAADDLLCVDLGGRRIIKKKQKV